MRKIICFLLAFMLIGTLSAAFAEDIAGEGNAMLCGESLNWYIDGSVLYITGQGDMYDFPGGAPWGAYRESLTRVILGDGVTSVGANAFTNYDSLYYVEFGSGIVRIGADAFSSCDGLTSITLPKAFKKFGSNSFRSCSNLKEIHCSGNFPRFDENCLWDTYCTIYFSTANPWSVIYIEQLETAFQGRIEFRASDGSDPYTPTEATQPVYVPETTYATQPTLDAPIIFTRPTEPVQTVPATVPQTVPQTVPTVPQTIPQAEPETTRETFLMATQATRATQPQTDYRGTDGTSIYGFMIIVVTLTIIGLSALIFRISRMPKKRRRRKKKKSRR